MVHKRNTISIVVPVYNERGTIEHFHKRLLTALSAIAGVKEVLYIDDNSTDGTYEWLRRKANSTSVRVLRKHGKQGKSYSLTEGFAKAKGDILVMIDGDLQYPPDAISAMVEKVKNGVSVVVARRKKVHTTLLRQLLSRSFRFVFGHIVFGLDVDIQSGLKAFTRHVYETVKFPPTSPWTFDLEFLYRAHLAGFPIDEVTITFAPRESGTSHINVFKASWEIGMNALALKFKKYNPFPIAPQEEQSMEGAGVGFKKRQYITHTTLPLTLSAMRTFTREQTLSLLCLFVIFAGCLIYKPLATITVAASVISILYFIDCIFTLYIILKSMHSKGEIDAQAAELAAINPNILPVYSVLCPLYKEAHIVPQFLQAIAQLDWPKDKLDVMLLLEEDDKETLATISQMILPSYVRIVVVPDSQPKTKPKACNYGLSLAQGEYLVIYDAEDMPDPLQLKKAYLGFMKTGENVICLQAKLNYYNARQNLLTRFFAAEYSLWFDLTLTGLQTLNSIIPLGGTSNHFKTEKLRELQGWDPFNVTEDADLGVRLFQKGYQTAIIDSTTYEEATSRPKNWLRQRSRWIKGYMQTYLVHTRSFKRAVSEKGIIHACIFQLTVGGKLLFILFNPVLWAVTILYYTAFPIVGPFIQKIYVPPFSYIAVTSFIFGNFFFLYSYMLGCAKREQWDLMKYLFLIPLYWIMMSIAGVIALYQLIFKPHYWEKTTHGFHLKKKVTTVPTVLTQPVLATDDIPVPIAPVMEKDTSPQATKLVQKTGKKNFLLFGKVRTAIIGMISTLAGRFSTAPVLCLGSIFVILGLDIFLAKFSLSTEQFMLYVRLSALAKTACMLALVMTIFTKKLFNGQKELHPQVVRTNIVIAFLFQGIVFVALGLAGKYVVPMLLGNGFTTSILYLPFYTFSLFCLAITLEIVFYNIATKHYGFVLVWLCLMALEMPMSQISDTSLSDFVRGFAYVSSCNVLLMLLLQMNPESIRILENNIVSILGLFKYTTGEKAWQEHRMNILIFNWRDTRHVFAGGAEVYVHELAKRWVQDGNKVTLFCGNDHFHPSYEVLDGVEVYRRGGTYTVYFFAVMYYFLKFRRKYDVIIDCENGIPFFTPLYTTRPVILLIHHIHQEIFRSFLPFPLNGIAKLLEGKLMPLIYHNRTIVTVSQSSKQEIFKLGFTDSGNIDIVHNGVSPHLYVNYEKTPYPLFSYVGRLKEYKNIDVAIKGFAAVAKTRPDARMAIVGTGESYLSLKALTESLGVDKQVTFLGKASEEEKAKLLSQSWAMIQPSQVEGWGITVIEANAAGTPVIASRVNGLRDSVVDGRTGILVEPGNIKQFATAMMAIMTDEHFRQQLSLEALSWSKNFNWDKSARDFYLLIGKSLGSVLTTPDYGKLAVSGVETIAEPTADKLTL